VIYLKTWGSTKGVALWTLDFHVCALFIAKHHWQPVPSFTDAVFCVKFTYLAGQSAFLFLVL
jgi:hypothetical protein